jgi:hypothetical protein
VLCRCADISVARPSLLAVVSAEHLNRELRSHPHSLDQSGEAKLRTCRPNSLRWRVRAADKGISLGVCNICPSVCDVIDTDESFLLIK